MSQNKNDSPKGDDNTSKVVAEDKNSHHLAGAINKPEKEDAKKPEPSTKSYKVLVPWAGTTHKKGSMIKLHPRQAQYLLGSHLELVK